MELEVVLEAEAVVHAILAEMVCALPAEAVYADPVEEPVVHTEESVVHAEEVVESCTTS